MRITRLLLVIIVAVGSSWAGEEPAPLPWKGNPPMVQVTKELIVRHPQQGVAALVGVNYVGPGLEREERHSTMAKSDWSEEPRRRRSEDNGRTWSDFEPLPQYNTERDGVRLHWAGGPGSYDPASKVTVSIWLRQPHFNGRYHNHCFARVSRDRGLTWGEPTLLRYEEGDDFDADDPLKDSFLRHNQAYPGQDILFHSNGTLIHAVAHANAPNDPDNDKRAWRLGSLCFVGKWDPDAQDYRWTAGKRVEISPEVSSRGLMEPSLAELKDGRVLVIWRGSNAHLDPTKAPGRKWYSVSSDGGMTLSEPQELKYDDGSRFYSPSSIHRLIRHSVSGKLYWIGNTCAGRTSGNSPRYPLVIAEVDEAIPALKRKTVTLIDDRQEGESAALQLSNFSLLENRETHVLELYLTRLGADPEDFWGADAYKYTLAFR